MFNVNYKPVEESLVYKVFDVEKFLAAEIYQNILSELRLSSGLSDILYKIAYYDLIVNFIGLVQNLPDYDNKDNSWVNASLERALVVVRAVVKADRDDPRVVFAMFSAALCFVVGRLFANYKVSLCDEFGDHLRHLDFLTESLVKATKLYRFRPLVGMPKNLELHLTLLLAYRLMAPASVNWLMEDPELFVIWRGLLVQDDSVIGELSRLFTMSLQELRYKKLKLQGFPVDGMNLDELIDAELFWLWLKQGLREGGLSVNDVSSSIHFLGEKGVFLEDSLFKRYAAEKNLKINIDKLKQAFFKMGVVHNFGDLRSKKFLVTGYKGGDNSANSIFGATNLAGQSSKGVVVLPGQLLLPIGSKQTGVLRIKEVLSVAGSLEGQHRILATDLNQQQF